MTTQELIFIGIRGTVLALHRHSGKQVWAARLKGGDFVNLIVENQRILATTYGEIFCLDPSSGQVLWHNPLKGYGVGVATIATAAGITSAPAALFAEKRRRDQQASAAAAVAAAG